MTNNAPPLHYTPVSNKVGRPAPLASYVTCEYTEEHPPAHEGAPHTTVQCQQVAIMMPGYYRSCAVHIIPMLRRSLLEYVRRATPANANLPPSDREHLNKLLQQLNENAADQTNTVKVASGPAVDMPCATSGANR